MKAELPNVVHFGREICNDYSQACRREWWLANGLGGYAAGTISQSLTRRYHGLLIAPTKPPVGRNLVFAKADATLHDGDKQTPLFSNQWGSGAIEPSCCSKIESFRLDGTRPVWRFVVDELIVEQSIWMESGKNTTYIAWRLVNEIDRPVYLTVDFLANQRDHHGESNLWEFNPVIEGNETHISLRQHGHPTLHLKTKTGVLTSKHQWIEDFMLSIERERGLADRDAHLCVAQMRMQLWNEWCGVVASLEADASPYISESMRRREASEISHLTRASMLIPELSNTPCWIRQLILTADSFLISRPVEELVLGESVVAGYPWFGDWGRDTMISLPGLTLKTGRFSSAKNILITFAKYINQGMLPNTFPEYGQAPEYNSVDAALWYIEAWRSYLSISGDTAALKDIFPLLEDIINWHIRGTNYGIGADAHDGLIHAGVAGVQLTWMDAKVGDWVVTPRHGKPVEVNALWYNALESMDLFCLEIKKDGRQYKERAVQVRKSFERFIKPKGGLYDLLDGELGNDASIRPNQILTLSLCYSPFDHKTQSRVLNEVEQHLLTPYGLRTLSPDDANYHPYYIGGVRERDSAYHQGTVWAWLLPHFALAEYRVTNNADLALSRLDSMKDHLLDAGLGSISEIFDGNYPHAPRGTPSQAWSVACFIEAWVKLARARTLSSV